MTTFSHTHQQQNISAGITPQNGRLIQRACACGGKAGPSGECAECRRKRLTGLDRLVQPKLRIGRPDDKYEREADRVADAVMRMPDPTVQRQPVEEEEEEALQTKPLSESITPLVQRQPMEEEEEELQSKALSESITPLLQRQPLEEEEEELQPKAIDGRVAPLLQRQPVEEEEEDELQSKLVSEQTSPQIQRQADLEEEEEEAIQPKRRPSLLSMKADPGDVVARQNTESFERRLMNTKGQGNPLPKQTRNRMEARFGVGFRDVRIHTGIAATAMNNEIDSLGFTNGKNIYFAPGQFRPETKEGEKLLAHELTHVIQQTRSSLSGRTTRRTAQHLQRAKRPPAFESKPYYTAFGKYKGKSVHSVVETSLRKANREKGLITEAPIPGGTTKVPYEFDVLGRADLYTSSDSKQGSVSGIRGYYSDEDRLLEEGARKKQFKKFSSKAIKAASGPVQYEPRMQGSKIVGNFPTSFSVADLKPLSLTKIAEGTAQIANYINGFTEFVKDANKEGVVSGSTWGDKLTNLAIPPGLRYKDFETESLRLGDEHFLGDVYSRKPVKRRDRFWIHPVKDSGLYHYFILPHPYPTTSGLKEQVDKTFAALNPIRDRVKNAPSKKISPTINVDTKLKPGVNQLGLRARQRQAPLHSMHTVVIQRQKTKRKSPKAVDWAELGRKWEIDRLGWDKKHAKPFLKGNEKIIERRIKVNQRLRLPAADTKTAFGRLSKRFKSIQLWSGKSGKIIGKVRFKLGDTFDKVRNFFGKISSRFNDQYRRTKNLAKRGHGRDWKKRLIKEIFKAAANVFKDLIVRGFKRFANCVNGITQNVLKKFFEDISEKLTAMLEGAMKQFESFYQELQAEFNKWFTKLEGIITVLKDFQRWVQFATRAVETIKDLVQIISCLEPPGLGCIWGFIVNRVAVPEMLNLLVGTDLFNRRIIKPAVQPIFKPLETAYMNAISTLIEKANLTQYAEGVTACAPVTEKSDHSVARIIENNIKGGLTGKELIKHRDKWDKEVLLPLLTGT